MAQLVLLRHAQPEGGSHLRYLGRSDPELSEEGAARAQGLRRALREFSAVPICSSPLRRARGTAALGFPKQPVHVELLATEMCFGVLNGLSPKEATRLYPEAHAHVLRHPLDAEPCGGENWTTVMSRARRLVERLDDGGSWVVVTHQIFIIALLAALPGTATAARPLDYAEFFVLEREGSDNAVWRVM